MECNKALRFAPRHCVSHKRTEFFHLFFFWDPALHCIAAFTAAPMHCSKAPQPHCLPGLYLLWIVSLLAISCRNWGELQDGWVQSVKRKMPAVHGNSGEWGPQSQSKVGGGGGVLENRFEGIPGENGPEQTWGTGAINQSCLNFV